MFPAAWIEENKPANIMSDKRKEKLGASAPVAPPPVKTKVEVGSYVRGGTSLSQYREFKPLYNDTSGWVPPSAPGKRVAYEVEESVGRGLTVTGAWIWYLGYYLPKKCCCTSKYQDYDIL